MFASFTPDGGLSLSEAAELLGYTGFDWLQIITKWPNPDLYSASGVLLLRFRLTICRSSIHHPVDTTTTLVVERHPGRRVRRFPCTTIPWEAQIAGLLPRMRQPTL